MSATKSYKTIKNANFVMTIDRHSWSQLLT